MILESVYERKLLLRTGFTGKQIEALYLVLNRFEIMGVAWDEAAVKPATCFFGKTLNYTTTKAGTLAAPPLGGVRA